MRSLNEASLVEDRRGFDFVANAQKSTGSLVVHKHCFVWFGATASQYSTTLCDNFYCATLVSDTAARCTGYHQHSVSLAICRTRFAKRRGSLGVTLVELFSGAAFWLSFNKFRKSRCCVLSYSCQQQGVVK